MKRNSPSLLAVLAFFGLCRPMYEVAAGGSETETAGTRTQFLAAIAAEGTEYERMRDRLLEQGEAIAPFLAGMAEKGGTWQERTFASLLIEHLSHREDIRAICDAQPDLPPIRAVSARWEEYAKALAERARQIPMFLVERVWKQNRLRWADPREARIYAMRALGVLAEKRAVFALIHVLDTENDLTSSAPPDLLAACAAIRDIGDAAAVPALLRTYAVYAGIPRFLCKQALSKCANKQSAELLRGAADHIIDAESRNFLLELANKVEKEAKHEDRGHGRGQ